MGDKKIEILFMRSPYAKEMDVMLPCIENAGDVIMKYFKEKNYTVSMKSIHDPLTEADLASNSLLVETIQKYFSHDAILSEEVPPESRSLPDRHEAARVWIIDPIDGTREFIDGIPEFSISVGLVENARPVLGFIFNPAQNIFIHGGKGIGIFINSKKIQKAAPSPEVLQDLYPCFSRSEFKRGLLKRYGSQLPIKDEQIFGSIAYKLAMVASGKFNLTVSYRPKNEWDIAAGLCLFEELGYPMTDLRSNKIVLNKKNTRSEGIIGGHPEAVRLYQRYFSAP